MLIKSVAIQGILGSFHHQAALKFFNNQLLNIIECTSFEEVCFYVREKKIDFGILAIENSIVGSLLPNFSLIEKFNLNIIGEIYLQVNMNLMAISGQKLENLHTIQSHEVAILQSNKFLSKYQNWNLIKKLDTATCAKEIQEKKLIGVGTIASKFVANMYNLEILVSNIQNYSKSFTRFYILSTKKLKTINFNKVSLYFSVEHKTGSLVKLLNSMDQLNINMTKIQSIPLESNPFKYSFYIDLLIKNYENYYKLIDQIKKNSSHFKILGEYKEDILFKNK